MRSRLWSKQFASRLAKLVELPVERYRRPAHFSPVTRKIRSSSSLAVNTSWEDESNFPNMIGADPDRQRDTCTCQPTEKEYIGARRIESIVAARSSKAAVVNDDEDDDDESLNLYPCGSPQHEDEFGHLPPPLPEPSYSVYKRILPASLTAMSSAEGRAYLLESLTKQTAESYWSLMEQFVNQSDPAFCGVTTLLMVLNAMGIDPNVRWRGGWRFFGSEEVLLDGCCLSAERIRRVGITLEEFRLLARCRGLSVQLRRPHDSDSDESSHLPSKSLEVFSLEDFRADIRRTLTTVDCKSLLVVSFSRAHLGQTGDGHFSPVAAYHEESDKVLILDVARFKYAPYWVSVEDLYHSTQPKDTTTKRSRGWFVLDPPTFHSSGPQTEEDRRPADLVPLVGEDPVCPIGRVKVEFCNEK